MEDGIRLIVGLGNPGNQYEKTRHNAGVWFIESLLEDARNTLRLEKKLFSYYSSLNISGFDCHVMTPNKFMNESGLSVKAAASFYKIQPQSILIVHDELDLPPGIARIKRGGGHGGHNGLRDIIQHLGTNDFYRIRLGIGHPGNSRDVSDYVLSAPNISDRKLIQESIAQAQTILPLLLEGQIQKAMHNLHSEG